MQQNLIENPKNLNYQDPIQLDGNISDIIAAAISNDDKLIASASIDQLILWDVEQKSIKSELNIGFPFDLAFSHDNIWLAAGCKYNIVIFNITNLQKEPIITLKGHKSIVFRIAFTMNSKFLISGSFDKTLRIWDVEQQNCIVVKELSNNVFGVSISFNQKFISAGCKDIMELTKWKVSKAVFSTIFTSDSKNVFIGCDEQIQLWSIEQLLSNNDAKVPSKVIMCEGPACSMYLKMNDSILISNDGKIKFWNSANGELIKTLEVPRGSDKKHIIKNVAVSSDMKYIITWQLNKNLQVYQLVYN